MIAKLAGVGPLSPPQPVSPKTEILEKITAEKIVQITFACFMKIVSFYVGTAASRLGKNTL
jgi:hypothetical protein